MIRRTFVWFHRWVGLTMTVFLVIVGLTGSLLAFKGELERMLTPQLYATPRPGMARLDLATLADRAESLVPTAQVTNVSVSEPDHAIVGMRPRKDPATDKPYTLGFGQLFLDPWTGEELGRRTYGDLSQGLVNLIPFINTLHYELALGTIGVWVLGIVALVWTIDCFIGFYLTLPAGKGQFWRHWKPAWLVKRNSGAFRLNFDLHRASGLWLWAVLLVFAWSSVYMNLWDTVYTWATRAVLDYRPTWTELAELPRPRENPRLDFHEALAAGERIMAEQASRYNFRVEHPVRLGYQPRYGCYIYVVRSSRDIADKSARTYGYFDGDTGALRFLDLPTGQYSGNTVTSWLFALHMADVFGLPYRIFVCVLGLLITMLSVTGVYIWWRKRSARKSLARWTGPEEPPVVEASQAERPIEA